MTILLVILAAALTAGLNALRGSGQGWMRPVVAAVPALALWALDGFAVPALGWPALLWPPLVTFAGVWLWLAQPWGRWYTLGQEPRAISGSPNGWEARIEAVADRLFVAPHPEITGRSGWADAFAWLISGTVFAMPLIALSSPWWLILTPLTIAIYFASILATGSGPHVRWGEAGKGVLIALVALLLAGCAQPRQPDWAGIARGVGEQTRR